MTDETLANLFAEGTAPERDAAFASRVDAGIERARRNARLRTLAIRALVFLTFAAALFGTIRVIEPLLKPLAESSPHFMGVPLPLVLGVMAIGLAIRAMRFVRLRLS
jgi:hypothetical protein